MVLIEPGGAGDLDDLRQLLDAASLTTSGLFDVPTSVVVARDTSGVVGAAAVEQHGTDGLLRSVVVAETHRGRDLGRRLVAAAETLASDRDLVNLFLLTETAEDFFARLGYTAMDRSAAPGPIAESVEWSVACADTALAMVKRIG